MKKSRLLLMLALAAVLTAACGRTEGETGADNGAVNTETSAAGSAETAAQTQPESKEIEMTVRYYTSDEDVTELKEQTADIAVSKEEEKYLAALKTLQLEEAEGAVSLWKNAKFLSAELKDGKLTVDLSLPQEARLGAPGESLALEAIERTAFQFEEVKELDLLVDGEAVESLMGHEELEHPIVRPS